MKYTLNLSILDNPIEIGNSVIENIVDELHRKHITVMRDNRAKYEEDLLYKIYTEQKKSLNSIWMYLTVDMSIREALFNDYIFLGTNVTRDKSFVAEFDTNKFNEKDKELTEITVNNKTLNIWSVYEKLKIIDCKNIRVGDIKIEMLDDNKIRIT